MFILSCFIAAQIIGQTGFKASQLKYSSVRTAYAAKEKKIDEKLKDHHIGKQMLEIYIRAFKLEKKIELWGRNKGDSAFVLLDNFSVCQLSGDVGPKRRKYDLQVPEGFYEINDFNPTSSYCLGLWINYPNASDRVLGEKGNLGGSIAIHGNCVTIGCLPIRDEFIQELYIYCVEARNNGQLKIPITLFPCALTESNFNSLKKFYADNADFMQLWNELKLAYEQFNKTHQLPNVKFLSNGRHKLTTP